MRIADYVRDLVRTNTIRRLLQLKNSVALTEQIRTRRGRVISSTYYVASPRIIGAAAMFKSLAQAEAYFAREVTLVRFGL